MPVYNTFHESHVNMKALNACREEDIDTLCDQLSVPFIYRLKLRGALDEYKKEMKKKEVEGTYVIEKAEKIALTNLQEKQELAKRLLKSIPKHLKGEFQTFFVCVWRSRPALSRSPVPCTTLDPFRHGSLVCLCLCEGERESWDVARMLRNIPQLKRGRPWRSWVLWAPLDCLARSDPHTRDSSSLLYVACQSFSFSFCEVCC